jgi:hypothetical protein
MVGYVKTAPLENDGSRMKDPPCGRLAFRAFRLRLVLKALLHLKAVAAVDALVFVDGHALSPRTKQLSSIILTPDGLASKL